MQPWCPSKSKKQRSERRYPAWGSQNHLPSSQKQGSEILKVFYLVPPLVTQVHLHRKHLQGAHYGNTTLWGAAGIGMWGAPSGESQYKGEWIERGEPQTSRTESPQPQEPQNCPPPPFAPMFFFHFIFRPAAPVSSFLFVFGSYYSWLLPVFCFPSLALARMFILPACF